MKGFSKLWKNLTQLDEEASYPLLMLYRNEKMIIEQVEAILRFSSDEIVLAHEMGELRIIGKDLFISFMYHDEITLVGTIEEILFQGNKGGNYE